MFKESLITAIGTVIGYGFVEDGCVWFVKLQNASQYVMCISGYDEHCFEELLGQKICGIDFMNFAERLIEPQELMEFRWILCEK
jgi:hypothetical protein